MFPIIRYRHVGMLIWRLLKAVEIDSVAIQGQVFDAINAFTVHVW